MLRKAVDMADIRLHDLYKTYGADVVAVDGVSPEVAEDELLTP